MRGARNGVARSEAVRGPYLLERHLEGVPYAARAGLDIALHDLIGKDLNVPLYRLFGLDPAMAPRTSLTMTIESLEETISNLPAAELFPIIK